MALFYRKMGQTVLMVSVVMGCGEL